MITLGEASRLTGLGKSTITRAIKAGRLSAARTDLGSYEIDPAELHRVYPFKPPATDATVETVAATSAVVSAATPDAGAETVAAAVANDAQVAMLKEVSELLRQQLADVKADRDHWRSQLVDVKEDRDHWRQQAERLALPAPASPPRRWWRRLTG